MSAPQTAFSISLFPDPRSLIHIPFEMRCLQQARSAMILFRSDTFPFFAVEQWRLPFWQWIHIDLRTIIYGILLRSVLALVSCSAAILGENEI